MLQVSFNDIIVRDDGMVHTKVKGWSKGTPRIASGTLTYVVAYLEDGKKKQAYVSKLIGHIFLHSPLKGRKVLVCHKKRRTVDSCDNSVSNLYLGTNSDNMKDRIKDGTCPLTGKSGELNSMYGRTGDSNAASKARIHYETFPTTVYGFKKICKNQGWDYGKFIKEKCGYVKRTETRGYYQFIFRYQGVEM